MILFEKRKGVAPIVGEVFCESHVDPTFADCQGQITIGDYVFCGHGVKILTGYHDYKKKGHLRQRTVLAKPVTIEDGVWLSSYSIILPGVTIGKNAVIGAGSVVTKDVPAGELWAGSPAIFRKKIELDD